MPRPSSPVLTQREAQIMAVLWELGEATAEQIRTRLPGKSHDSSVRTLLRILKTKGYLRIRPKSRPTLYRPAVGKSKAQGQAAKSLLSRFFDGSAEALVLRLLEENELTAEQLDALRESVSEQRSKGASP